MEWQYGVDSPVAIETLFNRVFNTEYRDIPDQSVFVRNDEYEARNIRLQSPAYVSDSTVKRAGEWTYYLELALIKELLEGWPEVDQDLLARVTHYAIYDDLPD